MEIYLVGGAVRDELLGLPVGERDWVVVGATPEEMTTAGFRPVGRDFPVFLHPDTGEEYALARTERKTGRGYRGFQVHASPDVTLEQDLARRDLTVNALARDTSGHLIDPYNGARDLTDRILRHVSPAFVEDPVRVLRVARFAARFREEGFRVAPETMDLMREMVAAGEVDALVPERVWQETRRALETDRPDVFIETLRSCGALVRIYPEIDRLFGVPQPARWHPEIDTGVHLLMVMREAARLTSSSRVRFAALVHDLGKGATPTDRLPGHRGHEEKGAEMVAEMAARLRIPNEFRDLGILTARYHGLAHRALELRPGTVLRLLERADALRRPERFAEFLLACEADMRGRKGFSERPYPQASLLASCLTAAAEAPTPDPGGLSGEEVGRRLREARLKAISDLLDSRRPPPSAKVKDDCGSE
ncbi:MAG: multifunctional CCA addition/repair protein [Gammaproteobacteria bacterium]|jgi:tRNA nucleotidyltransferase (CCA-adding enzyme)|nr:MAG: 2', 3'-cyclic nucleotide 2'-phosphodiesterase [Gammaproteobacteria bacterium SG8_31]